MAAAVEGRGQGDLDAGGDGRRDQRRAVASAVERDPGVDVARPANVVAGVAVGRLEMQ
ncbi:MAG: hypothetical protein ACR2ML_03885 [Solirubrobacteraceae bacterium]